MFPWCIIKHLINKTVSLQPLWPWKVVPGMRISDLNIVHRLMKLVHPRNISNAIFNTSYIKIGIAYRRI